MGALERAVERAVRTTHGRWVHQEKVHDQCRACRRWVKSGWRWFHDDAVSSAFVCDACAESA